jgi:WD40 repeat protein
LGRSRIGKWLSFSPDGTTLAATAEDGAVQRWKVADGARLSTTEPPGGGLTDARVRLLTAERGVAWGMRGTAAVVWEVPSGKLISTDGGHTTAVRGLAVTADGKHVITSAEDGALVRWELATGKPLGPVALRAPDFGYTTSIGPAALSAGAVRALARDSAGVGVYDLASGSQQYVIPTAADGWSQATFSPDGARVVLTSFGYDPKKVPARVSVWDAQAGKRLGTVELPGFRSVVAAVTPDGKFLVTAGLRAVEKGQP